MNTIDNCEMNCGCNCVSDVGKKKIKKNNGLEIVFSMVLSISAICGVWQASSLVISFVSLMQ